MNTNIPRIPAQNQNKTLPKLLDPFQNQKPTKSKFVSEQSSQMSSFAKIIRSFDQEEDVVVLDHRESSKKVDPSKQSKYKVEYIIDVVEKNEELDNLLNKPSKYVVYELINYYLALVGPVVMNIGVSNKVGVYISNEESLVQYKDGKKLVKVERKIDNSKPHLLDYNYYICEPREILSPTLIFKWLNCARNTFLEAYFGVDSTNYYMLLGLTGHSVLEMLIKKEINLSSNKEQLYKGIYQQCIEKMYFLNIKEDTFLKDCQQRFQAIYDFYKRHIQQKEQIEINKFKKQFLKVTNVVGAQYTIKSRVFGMKGKIDLLLECLFIDRKEKTQKKVMVPFQLKTGGKECHTHVYQVHVYNIVLTELFNMDSIGLLYYPINKRVVAVTSDMMNVHQVLIKRNEYVLHRKKKISYAKLSLPTLTLNPSFCTKCAMQKECVSVSLTQRKQIQDLQIIQNYESEQFKKIISLVDEKSKSYIEKWLNLIHLQERAKQRQYTIGIECGLDKFKITDASKLILDMKQGARVSQIILRSRQLPEGDMMTLENMFKVGDKPRMNVEALRSSLYLEIEAIRKINNRIFLICKAFIKNATFTYDKIPKQKIEVEIQKFGLTDSLSTQRSTVVNYILTENRHSSYKYIVDNQKSEFTKDNKLKWYFEQHIKDNNIYNLQQKEAIRKALVMKDFSLVEGYPGTGKTFLILSLIRIFRQINMKVLVTSFTNNSLSNILRKILDQKVLDFSSIIRFGNKTLKEGEFADVSFDSSKFKSLEEISSYFKSKYLWFVTLTSLYNELIPEDFDIVIVDEASQCIEPLCINSIIKAKKFILVGDYKQLGPVIVDKYAEQQGMRVSLFEKLCLNYPSYTTALVKQWRMCSEIMELTNNLVYDNALECASEQVASQILKINKNKLDTESELIQSVVNLSKPIIFLSLNSITDSIKNISGDLDVSKSTAHFEIAFVSRIYSLFSSLGVPHNQMTIISFFNKSNNLIVKTLKQMSIIDTNEGNVLTIDKSQGIDKECIVFLMESGSDYNRLAKDISRLNVSLTRAKSKLIVVGNKEEAEEIFNEKVFKILQRNKIEVTEKLVEDLFKK